jgi:DNA-binding Xre family transcriptional regulator
MVVSRVREVAEARGIRSSYELQNIAKLAPTMAVRLWRGEVTRFSVETLDKLCVALRAEVGELLVHVPAGEREGSDKGQH